MIDATIRARLDQHHINAQALFYQTISDGFFEANSDWAVGFSGLPSPTFNIFWPRTLAALSDDTLADVAAFFTNRDALYSIELIHDRFPDGPDFLDQRGYQSLPPQPAMFRTGLPVDLSINTTVEIEPVRTVPSLTAFCTLLHRVFDFPLTSMVQLFPVNQLKNEMIEHYLAFIDEQPVGAGTIICVDDVVSVLNICTLDLYRKRGVATTLLHRMLTDAAKNYCEIAMLYSTPQAYHLFNKFGFDIYTQRQWFLPPGLEYEDEDES